MSYCYNSPLLYYESIWSIVNKLGYWNVCNFRDLKSHFGSHKSKGEYTNRNILTKEMFCTQKIAEAIGVEETFLQKGTVTHYLDKYDTSLFIDSVLRVCPICIRSGYHSCFHQLLPLSVCEIHKVPLTNICPNCKRVFAECFYRDIPSFYACCNCGYLFTDLELKTPASINKEARVYDKVASILLRRNEYKQGVAYQMNFLREKTNRYFQESVWKLWSRMSGESIQQIDIDEITLAEEENVNEIQMSYPQEIYDIIKDHEFCVNRVGEAGYWFRIGTIIRGVRICPFALGYLIYYMYCNSRISAHGVRFTDTCKIRSRHMATIWKLEHLNIFYACLSFANKLYEANEIRIPTHEEIGTYLIYWEVSQSTNETQRKLYYFQPRGPIHVTNTPSMPCTTKHKEDLALNLEKINKVYAKIFSLKTVRG